MTQAALFHASSLPKARRGDIFALGRHRLACGDATDKASVAALFEGRKPTLVVTSPPYADARDYNDPIPCWDSMMLGAFDGHAFADDVQMLVNLGPIHRKGEWLPYWQPWLDGMRLASWRVFGHYIWDKTSALAGDFGGRLGLAHEYVWHLNKKSSKLNKTVPCKYAGRVPGGCGVKGKNNKPTSYNASRIVQSHRIMDSVLRLTPDRSNKTRHPAVYPVALPRQIIAAYRQDNCLIYDPFAGVATTLLACEAEGVDGVAMEISPAYCDLALARWRKLHPDQAITVLQSNAA